MTPISREGRYRVVIERSAHVFRLRRRVHTERDFDYYL